MVKADLLDYSETVTVKECNTVFVHNNQAMNGKKIIFGLYLLALVAVLVSTYISRNFSVEISLVEKIQQ